MLQIRILHGSFDLILFQKLPYDINASLLVMNMIKIDHGITIEADLSTGSRFAYRVI